MVEIEDPRKGLGDLKQEEIADTVERRLHEEDEEKTAGTNLIKPEGFVSEQVSAGTQHSDKFGERELEQLQNVKEEEEEDDDDDDEFDGPPPGWGSALPASLPLAPPYVGDREREQQLKRGRNDLEVEEKQKLNEVEEMGEKRKEEDEEQLEDDDDDDMEGPPPGWGSTIQLPHSFHPPGDHDKVKEEEEDDDDDDDDQMDGPPPGWSSPSWQLRQSSTPPHGQCSNLLPPTKRSHVFCKSCLRHLSYPQGSTQVRCSKCQVFNQAVEERAQMVCGFCRRLLSYPQGSRFMQCSLCKQVNYVLQEHEVAQLKCENCCELLMYPSGAPSVRCTKCHFVTDIGEHNRRPLLSAQQGRVSPATSTH